MGNVGLDSMAHPLHACSMCGQQGHLPSISNSENELVHAGGADDGTRAVSIGVKNAAKLMLESRVLDAEFVLAQVEKRLSAMSNKEAMADLRSTQTYKEVEGRIARYDKAGEILEDLKRFNEEDAQSEPERKVVDTSCTFSLVYEKDNARLWVQHSPGGSCFRTRCAIAIDASLEHCVVATSEIDLQTRWQTLLAQEPERIGERKCLRTITRAVQSVLLLRLELIYETFRYINKDYGALVETIRSDFPTDGLEIPDGSWFARRVSVDTTNVWLPRGGGVKGTIMVQEAVVELGFPAPESLIHFAMDKAAPQLIGSFRKAASLASCGCGGDATVGSGTDEQNPWEERLQLDKVGLYSEVREAEQAAANRQGPALDAKRLPGREVVERGWRKG